MWILPKSIASAYSAAQPDSTWELNSQASAAESSLTWRGKPTPVKSWLRAWKKATWLQRLFGRMCPPSMDAHFGAWWAASLAASRAKTSASPERKPESPANEAGSGSSFDESSPKFNLDWSSLRMSLGSGRQALKSSSRTLPRSGSMRSGVLSERPMLERLTIATDSSFWPTAAAHDAKDTGAKTEYERKSPGLTATGHLLQMQMSGARSLPKDRTLNPRFVEWLMGWPIAWTDCDSQVTEWFLVKPLKL